MIITATSQSPRRVTLVDEVSGNLTYIGIAKLGTPDASTGWQILRIQKTGSVTTLQYADGNARYDNIWNDRASLTYTN
jgi:hypothetical protein